MKPMLLLIAAVGFLAITGCASRRPFQPTALRPGENYTTRLGNDLIIEIKKDGKSDSLDIYLTRAGQIVAQFGANSNVFTAQFLVNPENDGGTVNVFVKDGKLINHVLVYEDDQVHKMIFDRDGDFFPDEQIIYDKVTKQKVRQTITQDFAPFQKKQ